MEAAPKKQIPAAAFEFNESARNLEMSAPQSEQSRGDENELREILNRVYETGYNVGDGFRGYQKDGVINLAVMQLLAWAEKRCAEAERRGEHAGLEMAEANIVSVISEYRDGRYQRELKDARRNLKIAFEQLHHSVDDATNLPAPQLSHQTREDQETI